MSDIWYIYEDGTADQFGVDHGNAKPIEVWHRDNHHIVFKVPGGRHWSSIMAPSESHPGFYLVCRIVDDLGDKVRAARLFEMPLSKRVSR